MSRDRKAKASRSTGGKHDTFLALASGLRSDIRAAYSCGRDSRRSYTQRSCQPRTRCTIPAALAELSVTLSHSPLSSHPFGTIHEPPMQTTLGCDR
ncbi:hypothetical protein FB548_2404 [Pseudoxanthomonas sp. 3HH-4]|nr:hypothetical protein FB548_2404 [Pseudoxanthomonas sp. 3HH-4]